MEIDGNPIETQNYYNFPGTVHRCFLGVPFSDKAN